MYGSSEFPFALCAVELRNYDCRAARYAEKKTDEEIDVDAATSAYGGESRFAEKLPDDDGIDRIVQLLKKGAEQNREKKRKKRAPYRSCENGIGCAVVAVAHHDFYCTALLCICPAVHLSGLYESEYRKRARRGELFLYRAIRAMRTLDKR